MDNNIYSNMLMLNEVKETLSQIELLVLEKNNMNSTYNEKIKALYEKYETLNKNLRKSFNIM